KKIGALTIAAVTLPFRDEGVMRWENACRGLDKLRQHADTVMVIQNDRLLDICPDMPLEQAFQFADETVINAIKSITELISQKGLVNLDFADVRAVMQDGGAAIIGIGEGEGEDRAQIAVEKALRNQLLNIEVSGAKRALIHLTGGPDMSLKDTRTAMKIVSAHLDASAQVIWGSRIDPNLDHAIRVMLIITGLQEHYLSADFRQRDLEDNKQVAAPGVDRKKDAGPGTENLRDEVTDHQSRQAIKQNGIPSKRVEAERENNVPGRTRRRTQPKIQHPPKIDGATVLPPAEASPERSGNAVSSRAEIDRDRGSTPRLLHPLTSLPQPTEPIARAQSRDPHDSSMLAQLESQMLKQKNESRDRQLAAPSSKITFSKALAEEIHAYLQSLHEAAAELLVAPTGQPALRRMKNAILAINYTAQRFAFFPLVDYATTVIEIFDRATNGEIKITEQFVNAVKPIGAILEGIQDDADAFMEAKQHREKLLRLMDAFTNQPSLNVTNNGGKTPKGDSRADDSFFLADSKPANTSTKNKPPTGQSVKPVFEVMDYLEK
ncbi:MAG: cell division FtsZ family protein, partial [candidate division KSB1 bacterium]|nr:cell division FtsZ family protein [candidate division KSB1 bacterium]